MCILYLLFCGCCLKEILGIFETRTICSEYQSALCTKLDCDFYSTCFKCLRGCDDDTVCTRPTPRLDVMRQAAFHQSVSPAISAVQRQQAIYNAIMDTQLCYPKRKNGAKHVTV